MKILILMPCDEQHVYASEGIYKALPNELKEKTFAMPMFMEYLVITKQAKDWIEALFFSLLSVKKLYQATSDSEHLIVIGNTDAGLEFDEVFAFQDIEEQMEYRDLFIEKLTTIVKDEELLYNQLINLHKKEESQYNLHNCVASADFIAKYIHTEYKHKLEKLTKKYEEEMSKTTKFKGVKLDVFPTSKQG